MNPSATAQLAQLGEAQIEYLLSMNAVSETFVLSRWVIFSFLCGLIRAFPLKMLQFYVPSVVDFGIVSICLGLQPFNSSENEEKEAIHVSLDWLH